jgi:hypothetical protein
VGSGLSRMWSGLSDTVLIGIGMDGRRDSDGGEGLGRGVSEGLLLSNMGTTAPGGWRVARHVSSITATTLTHRHEGLYYAIILREWWGRSLYKSSAKDPVLAARARV